jgi:serine protease
MKFFKILMLSFILMSPILLAKPLNSDSLKAAYKSTDRLIIKYKDKRKISILDLKYLKNKMQIMVPPSSLVEGKLLRMNPLKANIVKVTVNGGKPTPEELTKFIKEIGKLQEVEYVEPDSIMKHMLQPNDPRYNEQWHYQNTPGGANLEGAWDITTGSSTNVIAVIDTGYLPHTDLVGKILPGYDFISDRTVANDGDERDSNATDPGDWDSSSNSSWHGTHVSGTIAAKTNNGNGVSGINWNGMILPVRVLGSGGGYTSDIVDGMLWAAGISVSGVPDNSNPAQVLNLSLGGGYPCSTTEQNAIDRINSETNSIVVVAAGNSNDDAANYSPASCDGVITVAAVSRYGGRAYYSNYGSTVEIAAPGGDGYEDTMILSTLDGGKTAPNYDNIYAAYQGTSMATPHIAGIVSLIKNQIPTADVALTTTILQDTAKSFPSETGNDCTTALCGSGIVDATVAIGDASNSNKCYYSVSPLSQSFTAGGGNGVISVTSVPSGCTDGNWSATEFLDWVELTNTTSGEGSGSWIVNYNVTANSNYNRRAGVIAIGSYSYTINQAGENNLSAVLDTNLSFTTSGDADWFGQAKVKNYGDSAAQSGDINNSQSTSFETTVTGPGTIIFDWKVSSEIDYDFLTFYIDDGNETQISGEVDWTTKTFTIPSGTHTLKWSYDKDVSVDDGADAGWVDHVIYADAFQCYYSISPLSQSFTASGGNGTITVTSVPSSCTDGNWSAAESLDWVSLSGDLNGTGSGSWTVNYNVGENSDYSRQGEIIVGSYSHTVEQAGDSNLSTALDTNLSFSTSGDADWFGQAEVKNYGESAVQSGEISNNQTSSFETTVTGPATISFEWKVSSEQYWDYLNFYIDGNRKARISGELDWAMKTFTLPSGTYTLRWTYQKDESVWDGLDAGWVDHFNVIYEVSNQLPTANAGSDRSTRVNQSITITGSGSDPDGTISAYQWKEGETVLSDNASFVYTPATEGVHTLTLTVIDDDGATDSDTMVVTVIANEAPTANAGLDKITTVNQSISISGSGSDPDGTISSYQWKEGANVLSSSASFNYTPTVVGTHTLTLTVTDNDGATDSDTMVVTVIANQAPIANAGPDRSITVNETITITGSGSDPDGTISSYQWKEGGSILSSSRTFSYTPTTVGEHTLILTVTDNDGATDNDSMIVTATSSTTSSSSGGGGGCTYNPENTKIDMMYIVLLLLAMVYLWKSNLFKNTCLK